MTFDLFFLVLIGIVCFGLIAATVIFRKRYPALRGRKANLTLAGLLAAGSGALLAACGGGTAAGSLSSAPSDVQLSLFAQEANAPALTGDSATDAFLWINYRRRQAGVPTVTRNDLLDASSRAHSVYQAANNVVTHDEIPGKAGFTGATPPDRIRAAGYVFNPASFAYGEVIFANGNPSGTMMIEQLLTAIYHRFQILQPKFKEVGTAVVSGKDGLLLLTAEFAASNIGTGLGRGQLITYPYANQPNIPTDFFSDQELPDPVPDRNAVGYPISVHADFTSPVSVQSFSVQAHGGAALEVRLLTHEVDPEIPESAAAIIPLQPLASGQTYDVRFVGTVDGLPVDRSWSFTTQKI